MYKLLALDLDGTVLKSDHTISPVLIEKIQQLSQKIPVVIVTGRHHTAARPYYLQLGLKTPIICCNGTYIYDYQNETVLQHNAISKEKAKQFVTLVEQHDMKAVMYVKEAMLHSVQRPLNYVNALSLWADSFPDDIKPCIKTVDSFHEEIVNNEYIWKFVVEGGQVDHFLELPFVKNNFSAEPSWIDRVDISNVGNTKGAALDKYLAKEGLSFRQVVAVGDNHNDISMLQKAGMGVAMLNADNVVQAQADLVTSATNDDDYVLAGIIDKFFYGA
ncbi:Cof-type HAD-IIB family hydrolase [Marinomonas sp. 15G1-11]|uniref:Cof-type HAD-IIB family hydrolase n=1 Tax=Marinomonas phaeophyticola TaxID=3004091 RepID=A0ABT4JRS6_9GAMM|nr:Cof-type HAD-IIB family hydrolase [Marinomonas sp. 15G1-11]MCZ2721033.1 Cof-type HAD-IIB family hydrolase [Marinomonas sp. 15G1-11]